MTGEGSVVYKGQGRDGGVLSVSFSTELDAGRASQMLQSPESIEDMLGHWILSSPGKALHLIRRAGELMRPGSRSATFPWRGTSTCTDLSPFQRAGVSMIP